MVVGFASRSLAVAGVSARSARHRGMRTTTAALTLAVALPAGAQADSDDLEPSYGTNGRIAIAAGDANTEVHDALQQNGKVVVAGQARHNGDARFGASGAADATFGSGGVRMVDASPGKATSHTRSRGRPRSLRRRRLQRRHRLQIKLTPPSADAGHRAERRGPEDPARRAGFA